MPVYSLGDAHPDLPDEGEYWIAPNATLIGRVVLKRNASVWSTPSCAATTSRS